MKILLSSSLIGISMNSSSSSSSSSSKNNENVFLLIRTDQVQSSYD